VDKNESFIAAIKGSEGTIFKIASVYADGAEDRNDLVQEINYQLWRSFDTFNQKSSVNTWIYRVAMNVAIYHLKAAKKRVPTVSIDDQLMHSRETEQDEEAARWTLLKQSIEALNLLDKGIVILYLEDKSYEEIAEIVGISVSNVGTKLSRIKEKLKQQLNNQL